MVKNFIFYDIEVTKLACFVGVLLEKNFKTMTFQEFLQFHKENYKTLEFVGFNNNSYDNIVINNCKNNNNIEDNIIFSNKLINKLLDEKESRSSYRNNFLNKIATIDITEMNSLRKSQDKTGGLKALSFKHFGYIYNNNLKATSLEELEKYCKEDCINTKKLFETFCLEEYKSLVSLANFYKVDFQKYKTSIQIAKYKLKNDYIINPSFSLEKNLSILGIDEDLKEVIYKTYSYKKINEKDNTKFYTTEGYQIGIGGLHYIRNVTPSKYTNLHLYDFTSYYPYIYTQFGMFESASNEELKKALENRVNSTDETTSKSAKLLLNGLFGNFKFVNQNFLKVVTLTGQAIIIQLLRELKREFDFEVVEINTDGFIINKSIENLTEYKKIPIKHKIITELYSVNVNNKITLYENAKDYDFKGSFVEDLKVLNNLNLLNYKDYLKLENASICNGLFIVKNNKKEFKYYQINNSCDLSALNFTKSVIANKKEVELLLANNSLREIKHNDEIDNTINLNKVINDRFWVQFKEVDFNKVKFKKYLNNNELNSFIKHYKNKLFFIPKKGKINYAGIQNVSIATDPATHNEKIFLEYDKAKTLGLVVKNIFVLDVDDYNNCPKYIKNFVEEYKSKSLFIQTINFIDKNTTEIESNSFKLIFEYFGNTIYSNLDKKDKSYELFSNVKKSVSILGFKTTSTSYIASGRINLISDLELEKFFNFSELEENQLEPVNNNENKVIKIIDFRKPKQEEPNQLMTKGMQDALEKKLNRKLTLKNNNFYVTKCTVDHVNNHDEYLSLVVNSKGYLGVSCFAKNCPYNDKNSKEYKLLINTYVGYSSLNYFDLPYIYGVQSKNGGVKVCFSWLEFLTCLETDKIHGGRIRVYGGSIFQYTNGYYKKWESDGKLTNPKILPKELEFSSKKLKEIWDTIIKQESLQLEYKLDKVKHLINFKNGIYNMENNTFIDHEPDIVFFNQVPFNFVWNKEPHKLTDKVLNDFAMDKVGFVEDNRKRFLLQLIGLMMCNYRGLKNFFYIQGEGDTGKSTFLGILAKLLTDEDGTKHFVSKNIHTLDVSDSQLHNIMGKLAVISDENKAVALKNTETLKLLTSGEYSEITVNKKFAINDVSFVNTCLLIFGGNALPKMYDNSTDDNAFLTRMLLFRFNKQFTDGEKILDIKSKIDYEYLISLAIIELQLFFKNNCKILQIQENTLLRNEVQNNSSLVFKFYSECLIKTNDFHEQLSTSVLYNGYNEFLKFYGLRNTTDKISFFKKFKKIHEEEPYLNNNKRFYPKITINEEAISLFKN